MSLGPGQKAKLVNALDNQSAEDLVPMYSIDVQLEKAPNGNKCGALSVFKLNTIDLKVPERFDITKMNPKVIKEMEEAAKQASTYTESIFRDPVFFKQSEGRWINWALNEALRLYDEVGGSARISIKCARLRIEQRRSSKAVASLRGELHQLFPVAWDIDRLLDGDFSYDPWTKKIRRGKINATMSRR